MPDYQKYIIEALVILAETHKKGSGREAIWRVLQAKHEDVTKKTFLARLKKLDTNGVVARTNQKFRLS